MFFIVSGFSAQRRAHLAGSLFTLQPRAGAGARPVDSMGNPWSGSYVTASGNLLADMSSNVNAEMQGRLQVARLYHMTDDKGIRDMVLFAQHDVIQDPPFTQLDLLLCRNVLIYFEEKTKSDVMQRLAASSHCCLTFDSSGHSGLCHFRDT